MKNDNDIRSGSVMRKKMFFALVVIFTKATINTIYMSSLYNSHPQNIKSHFGASSLKLSPTAKLTGSFTTLTNP